jgi:hypothetical protein
MTVLIGDLQYNGKKYTYKIDMGFEDELNSDSPAHSIYVEYVDEEQIDHRTIWFYKKEPLYAAIKRSIDAMKASWSPK